MLFNNLEPGDFFLEKETERPFVKIDERWMSGEFLAVSLSNGEVHPFAGNQDVKILKKPIFRELFGDLEAKYLEVWNGLDFPRLAKRPGNWCCDKCKGKVELASDAVVFAYLGLEAGTDPLESIFLSVYQASARHLLPEKDGCGNILCEGSPSRAKYLDHRQKTNGGQPAVMPALNREVVLEYRARHEFLLKWAPQKAELAK